MSRNAKNSLPRAAYADMFGPTTGDRVWTRGFRLVAIAGKRQAVGFRGEVMGNV